MRLRNLLPAVAPVAAVLLAVLVALSEFGRIPEDRPPTSCVVIYKVTDEWSGGFTSAVTLINTGRTALDGWTLRWTFPSGQTALDVSNGVATSRGATVAVHNSPDNRSVPPAETAEFRLTGANGSRNEQPAMFTLNGTTCDSLA